MTHNSTAVAKSLDGPLLGHVAADITFGLALMVLLIVSCICNPVVFWCNRTIKQTIPAILYQILSFSDFLTCVLIVPLFLYTLLWTTDPWAYKPYQPWQQYFGALKVTVICMSNSVTCIFGVLRGITINRPLIRINVKAIVVLVFLTFVVILSCGSYNNFKYSTVWYPDTQYTSLMEMENIRSMPTTALLMLKYFVDSVISFVATLFCVKGLRKASKEKKKNGMPAGLERRGVITIIYLNILVVLQFVFIVICLLFTLAFGRSEVVLRIMQFVSQPFSNVFLSAMNPCITILRSKQILSRMKDGSRIMSSAIDT